MMIAKWARTYRSDGDLVRYLDDTTGLDLEPVAIDSVSGAPIGSRPFRIVIPQPPG
ncbi:hypothetical protein EM6_3325 (plasmid) [Asticcacaulis excentricus]|uniref:Uncharacterized protein n=2 Tax=Asticcacaulis excentricus TaxID=78587 RepID=A0A3G9GBS1_9CAUL|nr:hypothetical protein EM6_3325 [Asticcacaulis excentricus]